VRRAGSGSSHWLYWREVHWLHHQQVLREERAVRVE
jgi:hypothetical protein